MIKNQGWEGCEAKCCFQASVTQGEGDAFRCLTCTEPADFHAVRDIGENRADWPGTVAVAVMFFFHDVMATSWKKGIPFGMPRKKKILSWRTGRKGNAARFFHRSELVVDTDLDTGYAVIIVFVDFGDFLVFEVGIGELSIKGCPFGQAVKITDAVFFGVA